MFDYLMCYLYFCTKLKKLNSFLAKHHYFDNHVRNLGVAAYTSSFVYLIEKGVTLTFFTLLLSGIIISVVASKLSDRRK